MKMTLLEYTQTILSEMDADEVASITDTFESEQVATIVRYTYFSVMDQRDWPHLRRLVTANDSLLSDAPTVFTLDDNVKKVTDIRYDKRKFGTTRRQYKTVKWLEPDQFFDMTNKRNSDAANIFIADNVFGSYATELLLQNDKAPDYWTSFNDQALWFDSWDEEWGDRLDQNFTQITGYLTPSWTHEDGHYPDMPDSLSTLLLENSKSACFLALKQMVNEKAEMRSKRRDTQLSREAFRFNGGIRYPNYGRGRNLARNYVPTPLNKDD